MCACTYVWRDIREVGEQRGSRRGEKAFVSRTSGTGQAMSADMVKRMMQARVMVRARHAGPLNYAMCVVGGAWLGVRNMGFLVWIDLCANKQLPFPAHSLTHIHTHTHTHTHRARCWRLATCPWVWWRALRGRRGCGSP